MSRHREPSAAAQGAACAVAGSGGAVGMSIVHASQERCRSLRHNGGASPALAGAGLVTKVGANAITLWGACCGAEMPSCVRATGSIDCFSLLKGLPAGNMWDVLGCLGKRGVAARACCRLPATARAPLRCSKSCERRRECVGLPDGRPCMVRVAAPVPPQQGASHCQLMGGGLWPTPRHSGRAEARG